MKRKLFFLCMLLFLLIFTSRTFSTNLKPYWTIGLERSFYYHPGFQSGQMYLTNKSLLQAYDLERKEVRTLSKINYKNTYSGYNPYVKAVGNRVLVFLLKQIVCFDKDTAKELWTLPFYCSYYTKPHVAGNLIIAAQFNHEIDAVDLDGKIVWSFNLKDEHIISFYTEGQYCYVFSAKKKLYVLDVNRGALLKSAAIPVIPREMMIYAGNFLIYDYKNTLLMLDAQGVEAARQIFPGEILSAACYGQLIFVVLSDGRVYGLNGNLEIIWTRDLNTAPSRYLFVYNDQLMLFCANGDIVICRQETGEIKNWTSTGKQLIHAELREEQKKILLFTLGELSIFDLAPSGDYPQTDTAENRADGPA